MLLIDIDPQSNLTSGLGIDPDSVENSVYEVLLNPDQGTQQETLMTGTGVDLVPATLDLAGAEMALAGRVGRELLLREALQQTRAQYDYILIDTPPNLGLFTLANGKPVANQAHSTQLTAAGLVTSLSLSAMDIGASHGAMALGVGFLVLGIVIAGLGYALLGLITPTVTQRFGLHTVTA